MPSPASGRSSIPRPPGHPALPKYFPAWLVRAANGPLRRKVLFGSDFPVITPDRWLAGFAELDIKPEVRPLVPKANAIDVLGLHG